MRICFCQWRSWTKSSTKGMIDLLELKADVSINSNIRFSYYIKIWKKLIEVLESKPANPSTNQTPILNDSIISLFSRRIGLKGKLKSPTYHQVKKTWNIGEYEIDDFYKKNSTYEKLVEVKKTYNKTKKSKQSVNFKSQFERFHTSKN